MEDDFEFISLAALTANVVRWLEFGAGVQVHAAETPHDKSNVDCQPDQKDLDE